MELKTKIGGYGVGTGMQGLVTVTKRSEERKVGISCRAGLGDNSPDWGQRMDDFRRS